MAKKGKEEITSSPTFEEGLEEKSVEYLEELIEHNKKIIESSAKTIQDIQNDTDIVKKVLIRKRQKAIQEKLEKDYDFYHDVVLPKMVHSKCCSVGKPGRICSDSFMPGIEKEYDGSFRVFCPKCALEYIIDAPWLGIDINLTVDFNFDNY